MYAISKEFTAEAAHRLTTLPDTHKCSRLHGHSYRIVVEVSADTLDAHGFIVDYADLAPFGDWIAAHMDHKYLNDTLPVEPTAENMARYLYGVFSALPMFGALVSGVGVSETGKTWAWYRR